PPLSEAPRLYIPEAIRRKVDSLRLPRNFVAVHCSSNEASKDWPASNWQALSRRLGDRCGTELIEVGTHSVLGGRIAHCRPLCGSLSLLESAEVIRRARLFVGID